jgi:hypothetical protein
VTLSIVVIAVALGAQPTAPAPAPTCREWHDCQRLALDAYGRGEYEQFHDLAWRTVQTGPPRNADLMYLLARAQSRSGRPHDALVMLGRLAEMGYIADAETDDFNAVRQLSQWPELEATLATARAAKVSSPTAAAPVAAPRAARVKSPPLPAATPAAVAPSPVPAVVPPAAEDALRISGTVLGSAGLAYDRVSSRFVVADTGLKKLMILDQRSGHVVDLVTSASAGFYDITGLEIDSARGTLWAVSAESASAAAERQPSSALHKMQLVSGRPLDRIPVPDDLKPCRLEDVAVTRDGSVLLLDAAGKRVLRLRAGTRAFTPVASLRVEGLTSLAPTGDRIVYVAHASGIVRVDTVSGAVAALAGSGDALGGFERIRWAKDSLVGVQRLPDAARRVVRIRIVDGRASAPEIIDGAITAPDNPIVTVSGDEFYYVVRPPSSSADEVVIRRSLIR